TVIGHELDCPLESSRACIVVTPLVIRKCQCGMRPFFIRRFGSDVGPQSHLVAPDIVPQDGTGAQEDQDESRIREDSAWYCNPLAQRSMDKGNEERERQADTC